VEIFVNQQNDAKQMGVILQAAFRRTGKLNGKARLVTVPSPSDPQTPHVPWWYDHIAQQAEDLSAVGFTAVLLPPVCKTSEGASPLADGYGVFDDYDIGGKDQFDSVPTRFGSREQLQRLCAVLHANGIQVYADMVPHQRSGGHKGVYVYTGSGQSGRFPKHPSCFFGPSNEGRVPRDPIAGPVSDDMSFGDELCTVTSLPGGYVLNGLIDAGDWLTTSLDLQGYRIDDTKGQASASVLKWANSKAMAGKVAIGEYDDGNVRNINWWVWESGINGRAYAFDFPLHYVLRSMCMNPSGWDMSQLDHAGYAGISPMTAVTFVENPDTDTDGFGSIIINKLLAYAYVLTTEGYPTVYYRDYSTDKYCYGLKPWIDNLVWIHEHLANGETVFRWKNYQFVVYERTSYPNLLVGLNNDPSSNWKSVTVQTGFGANVHLHDYSGHGGDLWTDHAGKVALFIPPNHNGQGYVCYSRLGLGTANRPTAAETRQTFYGAADLDIGPATSAMHTIGRIWCAKDSLVDVSASEGIAYDITDANGRLVAANGAQSRTTLNGWYTISVRSTGTDQAFHLTATYHAPKGLNQP
jgi:alpha-amylase